MEQGSEDKARIAQKLGIVFATLPPIILQYATRICHQPVFRFLRASVFSIKYMKLI